MTRSRPLWEQVMRYKIAYSPGECRETDGWMQVGATHIEQHGEQRLVCELYQGVLVVEGGRVQTMLSFGDEVEPLPDDMHEAFTIPGAHAQIAADRFGDLVDFVALSRYFDGPRRIRNMPPPGARARPAWTACVVAGRPLLEVRATHFTTAPGSRTLVCELYPGILVLEKDGVCSVLTYGSSVELLPPRSTSEWQCPVARLFPPPSSSAGRCRVNQGRGRHRGGPAGGPEKLVTRRRLRSSYAV
ncbi:hypothetical protein SAMN04490239_7821 [Rhodococcus koreensis]|uniref:Uncharacterized protein n=1 Tax=Rhodococcus koreensis TaxID=99653 RepID=A0A1H4ZT90_9NOCA|nr:hypothetical protein SAMN04490239_7821 [Rhodococcus koreensis]